MFKFVLDQEIGILPRTSNLENLITNWKITKKPKLFDINFLEKNKLKIKEFDTGYSIF
jgi:hypothetical protein